MSFFFKDNDNGGDVSDELVAEEEGRVREDGGNSCLSGALLQGDVSMGGGEEVEEEEHDGAWFASV